MTKRSGGGRVTLRFQVPFRRQTGNGTGPAGDGYDVRHHDA